MNRIKLIEANDKEIVLDVIADKTKLKVKKIKEAMEFLEPFNLLRSLSKRDFEILLDYLDIKECNVKKHYVVAMKYNTTEQAVKQVVQKKLKNLKSYLCEE